MGEQRPVHGLTVDEVHRLSRKEVEPVAIRFVKGNDHLVLRGRKAHDGLHQHTLALLDVLAHRVEVCGEVDARWEKALFLLALALAVELLPPLGHEAERGLEAREKLHLFALTVELVAHGGVLPGGIAVIVFRAERHHLLRAAHEFIQINARDGDGKKTNGGEHAVASADVVGHDEFLVSLLIGEGLECAFVRVGRGVDALRGLGLAVFLFELFAEEAERDGGLGRRAGLRDDVDGKIVVADELRHLAQRVGGEAVADKVDVRCGLLL